MALGLLVEKPLSLNQIIGRMTHFTDPFPGQGDMNVRDRVFALEQASDALFTRRPGVDGNGQSRSPWTDVLEITELGRAVLRGHVDWRTLQPPPRWVGGVEIAVGNTDWRWNEPLREAVRRRQGPSTT